MKASGVDQSHENQNADRNPSAPDAEADKAFEGLFLHLGIHAAMLVFGHCGHSCLTVNFLPFSSIFRPCHEGKTCAKGFVIAGSRLSQILNKAKPDSAGGRIIGAGFGHRAQQHVQL
jgi:hypothetical protein